MLYGIQVQDLDKFKTEGISLQTTHQEVLNLANYHTEKVFSLPSTTRQTIYLVWSFCRMVDFACLVVCSLCDGSVDDTVSTTLWFSCPQVFKSHGWYAWSTPVAGNLSLLHRVP